MAWHKRLFAALITNTCSLITRLLPMERNLVMRLEYMHVFAFLPLYTRITQIYDDLRRRTYQYRADKFKECRAIV